MPDLKRSITGKFKPETRFSNFGNMILKMQVMGFRAHDQTEIEVTNPITAFSGFNGTGKTTLLQIAACAYAGGFHLNAFFAKSYLDPNPYRADAKVVFEYTNTRGQANKRTTISRGNARWKNYTARPARDVHFIGCGHVLPLTEERDVFFKNAAKLAVSETRPVSGDVTTRAFRILRMSAGEMTENDVEVGHRQAQLLGVRRGATVYAEHNMGFGERRVLHLVRFIEAAQAKSLILIEEPEISLHQSAQYAFGEYLLDVVDRKGHQIFLTTHSEHLLRALPAASRIYMYREPRSNALRTVPGLSAEQLASLLADGYDHALTVIVEDTTAKAILEEIFRTSEETLLQTTRIEIAGFVNPSSRSMEAGGHTHMRGAMRTLKNAGLRLAAVIDADQSADADHFIFKLPGTLPPEKELMNSTAVQAWWMQSYPTLNVEEFLQEVEGVDHHDWFSRLARRVHAPEAGLIMEAARAYAQALMPGDRNLLIRQLMEAMQRQGAPR